ncbi:MAG: hypothetical protein ACK4XJ_10910 [Fimbriimonadaceae bacterium]
MVTIAILSLAVMAGGPLDAAQAPTSKEIASFVSELNNGQVELRRTTNFRELLADPTLPLAHGHLVLTGFVDAPHALTGKSAAGIYVRVEAPGAEDPMHRVATTATIPRAHLPAVIRTLEAVIDDVDAWQLPRGMKQSTINRAAMAIAVYTERKGETVVSVLQVGMGTLALIQMGNQEQLQRLVNALKECQRWLDANPSPSDDQ